MRRFFFSFGFYSLLFGYHPVFYLPSVCLSISSCSRPFPQPNAVWLVSVSVQQQHHHHHHN
jgi:hypothetical protein